MRILGLLMVALMILKAEDAVLLNAHIKMIPKIMALDSRLAAKGPSAKALLAIVYEGNRRKMAQNIADDIHQIHNGKVSTIGFDTIVLSVEELLSRRDITFVYLTKTSTPSARKIAAWGINNTIPTFSYDVSDLEEGILGSIAIERSTVIYINKTTLKEGKYRFNETLFQIARLTE